MVLRLRRGRRKWNQGKEKEDETKKSNKDRAEIHTQFWAQPTKSPVPLTERERGGEGEREITVPHRDCHQHVPRC
jgi:hypothetical protein